MKTALIAGSSGLVGELLTKSLLKSQLYDEIILLVRSPNPVFNSPKIKEIIIDFDQLEKINFKADHIYCCLGTTIKKAKSKEQFYKVDCAYPLELATACYKNGGSQFHLVTAMGANKASPVFYNKVKGEAEEKIIKVGFPATFIYRPSFLNGNRKEYRLGETIMLRIASLLSFAIPKKYKIIEAQKIANAMIINAGTDNKGVIIMESDVLQNF